MFTWVNIQSMCKLLRIFFVSCGKGNFSFIHFFQLYDDLHWVEQGFFFFFFFNPNFQCCVIESLGEKKFHKKKKTKKNKRNLHYKKNLLFWSEKKIIEMESISLKLDDKHQYISWVFAISCTMMPIANSKLKSMKSMSW